MTVFVSSHAIDRYRQRIEKVPSTDVCLRIREAVKPHLTETMPTGEYRISSRRKGPPFDAIMAVHPGGRAEVMTVMPVTDTQITRALKDKTWTSR